MAKQNPHTHEGLNRIDPFVRPSPRSERLTVGNAVSNLQENLIYNYKNVLFHIVNRFIGETEEARAESATFIGAGYFTECRKLADANDPSLDVIANMVVWLAKEGYTSITPPLWLAVLDFLKELPTRCNHAPAVITALREDATPMFIDILQTPDDRLEGGTGARIQAARLLAEYGSLALAGPVLFRFRNESGLLGSDCTKSLQHLLGLGYDMRWPLDVPIHEFVSYYDLLNAVERHKRLVESKGNPPPPPPVLDERTRHLDALLATVPRDVPYEEQAEDAAQLNWAFRERLAERLAPTINAKMTTMPHETLDQKKELAKWVNAELRRFNLAIKHPKTGTPCYLISDKGNHPQQGRFQLRAEGVEGKVETFSTPKLEVLLDVMKFMDAPPREEGLANWADKAKRADKLAATQR